jgi:MFS family permease
MKPPFGGAFRSLRGFNYRVWVGGAFVSNIGTWVQRTAQDWLVLTQLTHHDASAVGLVMALQFGPQFLFLPLTGYAADHFNQRRLLIVTQATMAILALALGVLTVTGLVRLWHVYVFAFLFGSAAAFDAPVRQTFVSELVGDEDLHNAVALNSTSFNAGRMIGPAVSGLVIAAIGTGWAFLINGASFVAVLVSLAFLRAAELRPNARAHHTSFTEGFRYVWRRPDLKAMLVMLFLVGTFGLNFPIFISTMAVSVFHADAKGFGLLSSIMAVGTITGALLSARREKPRFTLLLSGSAVFGIGCTLAAVSPGYWFFAGALVIIGIAALTLTNTSQSLMQLTTEPAMRGRVMALRVGIALGGTPIGAPIVGWVANHFGPRWALGVGAASGFTAAIVAIYALARARKGLSPCS